VTINLAALPEPIRAYLTGHDDRDDEAAARTFAPHATVTDEGQSHTPAHKTSVRGGDAPQPHTPTRPR